MANKPADARSLLAKFLPVYDFDAVYETRVNASPAEVYEHLLQVDLGKISVVQWLMTLRTGKRLQPMPASEGLRERMQKAGFILLAQVPADELVFGVAGRFWHLDGGRCIGLSRQDFVQFAEPGYAKAVWNFKLRNDPQGGTALSTETRVKCFADSLWKFYFYWTAIAPFSGLIRKAMLKQIKRDAESSVAPSRHQQASRADGIHHS